MDKQKSNSIFDKYFMHSIDILCVADINGNFIKLNPEWNKTLGYDIAEMEGKPYIDFVHPGDVEKTLKVTNDIAQDVEVKNFINRYRHKDGTYRLLEWFAFSEEDKIYASGRDITKTTQSDEAFFYDNLHRTVLDAIAVGLIYAKNNRFEWVNSTFLKMVKYRLEDIKGQPLSLFLNNRIDFEKIHIEALACFAKRNVYYREIEVYNDDKSISWISLTAKAVVYKKPEDGTVWMIQDITERQQAKEALIESEERARLFVENTPLPIALFDINMCYMVASKRWSIDYNLGNQELIGRSHYEVFPEIPDRWKEDHRRVLKGEVYKNESDRFERLDGTVQWLRYELHPWYKSKGQIGGLVMFTQDITESKEAKKALIESEERARLFIENTPLPIAMFDTNMCYMVASKRWSVDYNLGSQKLIGRSHYEVFPEIPDRWKEDHQRVLKGEVYKNEADRFERADGTKQWLRYELHPWYKSKGEIGGLVMFTEDITDRKQAENQLNQTVKKYLLLNQELTESLEKIEQINSDLEKAKLKAEESDNLKTAFLANLSHEIRTPMNGILGFADLLKGEGLSQNTKEKYVNVIEQSGKRMLRLINDLVDISKIESNQVEIRPERTNLNNLMDKIYNFFRPQADRKGIIITYNKDLSNHESNIFVDNLKLEQILTNLINNALKFTAEGGIYFCYTLLDNRLTFKVKDTGIGIPTGMEKVIFERFRQAENNHLKGSEGSGLGLSISKAFIELMGGKLWVESENGRGSEFIFTLPYNPVEKEISLKQNQSELLFDNGITILIAEDDEMSYLFLEQILLNNKFNILHAKNGNEAVQFMNEYPEIKIILMDLKMPLMNGIEATSKIRKKNSKVPIIAQTAYTSQNDKQKALNAGCNDYITKPIHKELLLEKIKYLLSL